MAKKNIDKKDVPFVIVAGLLGLSVLIPVVILVISSAIHHDAADNFNKSLYPVKYESYVEKASKEFGVDECLIYGVIRTESNFDADAVSSAGAIGLMQLMPDTFTWLQNYRNNFETDKVMNSDKLYDPKINIEYGVYYLSYLLEKYDDDKTLAICAYNAGYGNVDSWIADGTIPNHNVSPESVPFSETSNYLRRVTESMNMYRELYFSKLESYSDVNEYIPSDNESVSENSEAFEGESQEAAETSFEIYSYQEQEDIDEYNYEY